MPNGKVINFPKKKKTEKRTGTMQDFHELIAQGYISEASEILEDLMGLPADIALNSAKHYKERLSRDPDHLLKVMSLRSIVSAGVTNDALFTVEQCFGLDGMTSLSALNTLLAKFQNPG